LIDFSDECSTHPTTTLKRNIYLRSICIGV
jgi:hypothetical protein